MIYCSCANNYGFDFLARVHAATYAALIISVYEPVVQTGAAYISETAVRHLVPVLRETRHE